MSAVLGAAEPVVQSAPQLRYAAVLEWGTRVGLAVLVVSFLAYLFGWLPAHVAPHDLPRLRAAEHGNKPDTRVHISARMLT